MIQVIELIKEVAEKASEFYIEQNPKAKPVTFIADNFVIIGQELNKRSKSEKGMKEKYPAILLFTDNLVERPASPLKQWETEVTLHILIVTDAIQGDGEVKRKKVFYPVLYPIYEAFLKAIEENPRIYTKGESWLTIEKYDRLNLVAVLGRNSVFADKLDGIEIRNLRLRLKDEFCFKNNLKK